MPETARLDVAPERMADELARAKRQIVHLTEEMAPILRGLVAARLRQEKEWTALSEHLITLTIERDAAVQDAAELRAKIKTLQHSPSWRLTRPLRALARLARRYRQGPE